MGTWWLSSGQQELRLIGPLGLDEGACDLLRGEFVGSAGDFTRVPWRCRPPLVYVIRCTA